MKIYLSIERYSAPDTYPDVFTWINSHSGDFSVELDFVPNAGDEITIEAGQHKVYYFKVIKRSISVDRKGNLVRIYLNGDLYHEDDPDGF